MSIKDYEKEKAEDEILKALKIKILIEVLDLLHKM